MGRKHQNPLVLEPLLDTRVRYIYRGCHCHGVSRGHSGTVRINTSPYTLRGRAAQASALQIQQKVNMVYMMLRKAIYLIRDANAPFACRLCKSELPPMCFLFIKTLGTVLWPVISCKARCITLPLSISSSSTTL